MKSGDTIEITKWKNYSKELKKERENWNKNKNEVGKEEIKLKSKVSGKNGIRGERW